VQTSWLGTQSLELRTERDKSRVINGSAPPPDILVDFVTRGGGRHDGNATISVTMALGRARSINGNTQEFLMRECLGEYCQYQHEGEPLFLGPGLPAIRPTPPSLSALTPASDS